VYLVCLNIKEALDSCWIWDCKSYACSKTYTLHDF